MTDYEYILKQARKFHYSKWDDAELRKCVDMLPNLSREELKSLTMSRWTREAKILRESIFNILFKDQIGKREERIRNLETNALIAEFQDRKSGNVSLCRLELRERYQAGRDMEEIAEAFNNSGDRDQSWLKKQEKTQKDGEQ
ncbi:MAG: hypothetical protein IKD75_09565 [Prevotella sp.]|nr:hypothetical protein [Prevotella sp.]